MELFVLTDNMLFESVFYRGKSKIPLLFELILRLHQVQMRGYFTLNVVHIAVTRTIEAKINGISRGNNLGGMMIVLDPLHFVTLD